MKPEEIAAVDIFKHYRVIRQAVADDKSNEGVAESTGTDTTTTAATCTVKPPSVNKKSLNIPICDVRIDPEYEKNVTPTYIQSIPYVKHVRKIGDEAEITTDYQCDKEDETWMTTVLFAKYPDEKNKFNLDKLETAINIFERANGTVRDTLPQAAALKAITEKSGFDQLTVMKLTQDMYKYWVNKRDKLGKPLCRRYWPPTLANDTNPHQVFRVRDRERYKLRRQHRRNDMDSFRKMQQLRKEFQQAKTILQLMLERELLAEAGFKIGREMFEQQIFDLQKQQELKASFEEKISTETSQQASSGAAHSLQQPTKRRKEKSFSYDPFFKHLWMQQTVNHTSAAPSVDGRTSDGENEAPEDDVSVSVENASLTLQTNNKRGAGRPPKGSAPADPTKTVEKKKKSKKEKTTLYTMNAEGQVEILPFTETPVAEATPVPPPVIAIGKKALSADLLGSTNDVPYLGYTQASMFDTTDQIAALAKDGNAIIHEEVDGPPYVCRPHYPHFLFPLPSREPSYNYCSPMEYLQSLEYKYDDNLEVIAPMKYKARCRIGRGGRLVVDRIPIYPEGPDEEAAYNDPANHYLYQYPVSLRPQQRWIGMPRKMNSTSNVGRPPSNTNVPENGSYGSGMNYNGDEPPKMKIGNKSLPEIPISNRKLFYQYGRRSGRNGLPNQNVWASALPVSFQSVPPLAPPSRILISAEKANKLASILAESDSEDEKIIIPKSTEGFEIDRSTNSKSAASEQAMTKILLSVGPR